MEKLSACSGGTARACARAARIVPPWPMQTMSRPACCLVRVSMAAATRPLRVAKLSPPGGTSAAGASQKWRHASRSEEHTSELQSLMRLSYAVFCLKKKKIYKYEHD